MEVPASGRRAPVAIRRYSQNPINAPEAHANEIRLTGVHSFRGVTRPLVTFRVVFFVGFFSARTAGMGKRGRGHRGRRSQDSRTQSFSLVSPLLSHIASWEQRLSLKSSALPVTSPLRHPLMQPLPGVTQLQSELRRNKHKRRQTCDLAVIHV